MKIKKTNNSQTIHLLAILILIYVSLNGFTTYNYYTNYNQGINTLAEISTKTGQDGIDIVAEILKNNTKDSIVEGKKILEEYGYLQGLENALYRQFVKESVNTAVCTLVMFVLLFFMLLLWKQSVKRKEELVLNQIEETVSKFRENDFEVILEMDDKISQEKIKYQLEALGNHIKLLKEEAKLEKEGTKELVSDISHQLKTPVAALDACFSVLLSDDLSKNEQEEFRVRCRNALDGLETLLQSLLEISKLEAGLIQITKSKLPLMETIVIAINRVYPKASEKNIDFSFDYDASLENYEIMQDKKWLSEAIINVLDNAIKYSDSDSEITVHVQKRIGFARIEIEDQGIGIPKEEYHKIFQRFFRGSLPRVKEASGSGIGLFLSREIIDEHHGTITVSSHLEDDKDMNKRHGSIFVIQLPDIE